MAKAHNNSDTYKAVAVTLIVFGILYLVDRLVGFGIFLLLKHDKSVGLVLIGLWVVLNFGLITALLGTMSAYLLPVALLLIGIIIYFISTR